MSDSSTSVADLREIVREFVDERDWEKFHAPKNISMAMAVEAAELMEHFQWISVEDSRAIGTDEAKLAAVGEELADVLCYGLALANTLAEPGAVVSCNHPPDRSFGYRRLCGTTNVQGRAVNGDDDVCRRSVQQGAGRFIHVEHASSFRKRFEDGWRDPNSDSLIQGYLKALRSIAPSIP